MHWDFDRAYTNLDKVLAKFRGPEPLKRMIEDPVRGAIDISIPEEIKTRWEADTSVADGSSLLSS